MFKVQYYNTRSSTVLNFLIKVKGVVSESVIVLIPNNLLYHICQQN